MTYQQIEDSDLTLSMITNQDEDELPKTYDELFAQLEEKGILFEEFWAALVTAQKLASKVNNEGE
jgi:uncharacterized protein YutE (UPF0331/DUF86 family)